MENINDFALNMEILNDEQKEFLKKHSLSPDFIDALIKKFEAITIKVNFLN